MKKSLSLVVAAAMTISAASVAFADTVETTALTSQQKFDALKAKGILEGYPDGSAGLNKEMTRAEFAKVLTKLADLEENAAAAKVYKDVPTTHWAAGFIGAATEAKLMNGVAPTKFDPSGKVTVEQIAKVADLVAGVDQVDAPVSGKVSAWAKGYVAAAIKAGLLPELPSYQTNATRELLVNVAYNLATGVGAVTVTSAVATDATHIEVKFSDGGVVKKTLDTALVSGKATKVEVEYSGKKYQVDVTLAALDAAAKVVGAKKIEVKFNQAVDTTKVTFDVKNAVGSVVNVSKTTFSDDKTTATIEFTSNLIAGDFTITTKGATTDLTSKVTVSAEKITKIEFLSDKAVLDRADSKLVTTSFKITNQYGEDVTSAKKGQLTFTAGKGTTSFPANTSSKLLITSTVNFAIDEKLAVSVIDPGSNVFASAVLTVSTPAKADQITIDKLYNVDNKTLDVTSTPADFKLVLSAKDQYGNNIEGNQGATDLASDVIVTVSNTVVANVAGGANSPTFTWDSNVDGGKLTLALAGPLTAGTSKVTVISRTTGKLASFDVAVKEGVKVDTLTVSTPVVAAAGSKIIIPFTAVDQFGNAVTSATTLNAGVNSLSLSNGHTSANNKIYFEQDYVKKTANLVIEPVTAKGTYIFTAVTGTNKVVQLTINVTDGKVATVVSGIKDFTTTFAVDGASTFTGANVIVKDQYGSDITVANTATATALGQYHLAVSSSDTGKVSYNSTSGAVGAVAKGSSTFTVKLQESYADTSTTFAFRDIQGSAFTFTVKVVEKKDIASYELADITTLLDSAVTGYSAADHARKVTVNGVLADGSKVVVPSTYYTVTTSNTALVYASGKLTSTLAAASFNDAGIREESVIVTVDADGGAVVLTKPVKISNVVPTLTTLSLVTNGVATVESSGAANLVSVTAANLATNTALRTFVNDAVKAVDQYGVELTTEPVYTIVVTGLGTKTINGNGTATATTVVAGNTFSVNAIAGGKNISFQVLVK